MKFTLNIRLFIILVGSDFNDYNIIVFEKNTPNSMLYFETFDTVKVATHNAPDTLSNSLQFSKKNEINYDKILNFQTLIFKINSQSFAK